jgi:hypothetical protein
MKSAKGQQVKEAQIELEKYRNTIPDVVRYKKEAIATPIEEEEKEEEELMNIPGNSEILAEPTVSVKEKRTVRLKKRKEKKMEM